MTIHLLKSDDPARGQAALLALADSLDSCSVVIDRGGLIVGMTQAWQDFKGANPLVAGHGLGARYAEICQGLTRSPDGHVSIVAQGLTSVFKGEVHRLSLDYPFLEAEGLCNYGCTAVLRPAGETILAVVHIRDITQKAAQERRMRRSERLFKATTDNAMDFICLLDPQSQMIYHNPALERFLGRPDLGVVDRRMVELVHPEDQARFMAALQKGARAGLTQVFEYRFADVQGAWMDMEGQVSAVDDPGGQEGTVLLISRDISLRKQMERDRESAEIQIRHSQKLEAIGQLAAGIAHEINTPTQYIGDNTTFLRDMFAESMLLIHALKSSLERIREGAGPDAGEASTGLAALEAADLDYMEQEIPKAILQTLEGVARVSKIVGAMKDFSHPGGEAASALDLHRAIESTITVSSGEWKTVARLDTDFAQDFPLVPCYAGEINQVILNLVVNAAHAIAARREAEGTNDLGRISIGTRLHAHEAEIWVSDDGTGIPVAIQGRIFDPFFTTKSVGKGTGQGLSIVHAVVTEKHKGRISLKSSPGQGTTFHIFLPLSSPSR